MPHQSTQRTAPVSTTPVTSSAELPAGVADLDQAREKRRGRVIREAAPNPAHGLGRHAYGNAIQADRNLTAAEYRVLNALWKRTQDRDAGLYAWPSAATLASDLGFRHARDARRHLANLRTKGYLEDMKPGTWGHLVPRVKAGRDVTTLHVLCLPLAAENAPQGVGNSPRGGMGNSPTGGVGNSPIRSSKGNSQMKKEMPIGSAASASRAVENLEDAPAEPVAEAPEQPQAVTAETTAEQPGTPAPSTRKGYTEPKGHPTPKRGKRQRHTYTAEFTAFWDAYQTKAKANPGSKARAFKQWEDARRHYTAEDLAAMLDRYTAGRVSDRAASSDGFIPDAPDLCNWLEQERWEDYADAPETPATREPGRWTPDRDGDMYRRRAANVGDWQAPETPADLSPTDADAHARADYTDWLTGTGRWERSTVAA